MEADMKTCPFCAEEIRTAAIKCKHCGSMLDGDTARPAAAAPPAQALASVTSMQPDVLFEGKPSWRAYFGSIAGTNLVLGAAFWGTVAFEKTRVYSLIPLVLIIAVIVYWRLRLRSERVGISNHRIETQLGILSRRLDTLELWRVNDIAFEQSIFDRLIGRTIITVYSQDKTAPVLRLVGLPGGQEIYRKLRDAVDRARQQRRVLGLID